MVYYSIFLIFFGYNADNIVELILYVPLWKVTNNQMHI